MALQTALESARMLRTCRGEQSPADHLASVEQETTAMLLIGSLLHERCDPVEAQRTFGEAACFIQSNVVNACVYDETTAALIPLLEVSTLLASAHCAPEA